MAVVFDAMGTAAHFSGAPTYDLTTLTVGSNPNTVLVLHLVLQNGTALTLSTPIWDAAGAGGSPQNMTLVTFDTDPGATHQAYIYALFNPNPGNRLLRVAWTPSVAGGNINAVSFSGADTSGPIIGLGSTFYSPTSTKGTGATATLAVTSATDEMVTDFVYSFNAIGNTGSQTTPSGAIDNAGPLFAAGSGYQAGAASVTSTWSTGGGNWLDIGTSIKAAGAGPTLVLMGQICA